MLRNVCFTFSVLFPIASALAAAVPTALAPFSTFLLEDSSIRQIATDSAGDIYVFGQVSESPVPGNGQDVFIAKLNPAATEFTYFVYFGGSSTETASGLAVDAAGNAYITGSTASLDFPTLPQTAGPASSNPAAPFPFAAKFDPAGALVYSMLFSVGIPAQPAAIAVDANGEAIISGQTLASGFPSTAGAYSVAGSANEPFVVKLDATGTKLLFSATDIGGGSLALDSSSNIFIAGNTTSLSYPTTPGAFQTTFTPSYSYNCISCTGPVAPTPEQYVTKLSADGSTLLYSTFLTGISGSSNHGLAVDASGDAWVTGETASPDYPYTGAQPPGSRPDTFTTELDSAGANVLLSVQQGGSGIAVDSGGNIILAGNSSTPLVLAPINSGNPNPPPLPAGNTPAQCLPGAADIQSSAWVMRLSREDGSVLGTNILAAAQLTGVVLALDSQDNIYIAGDSILPDVPLTPGIPFASAVSQRIVSGSFLMRTDLSPNPVACVTDAFTLDPVGPVAPGQLLTLFGTGIGPAEPVVGLTGAPSVPVALGGVSVTFDGIPAPLLYVSSTQINVQVPFEVSQNASPQTVMQVSFNGSPLASRLFVVVPSSPGLSATVLNQDGSVNSAANPAQLGSDVTLFVDGVVTERENSLIAGIIEGPVTVTAGEISLQVDSALTPPNALAGIGQIQVRLPIFQPYLGPFSLGLTATVNGVPAGPFSVSGNVVTQAPYGVLVYIATGPQ